MIYRGFNIRTVDAIDLQRHNYSEHKTDFCDGVYVELYDQADDGLTERSVNTLTITSSVLTVSETK